MPTRKDNTKVASIYKEPVFIPASGATLIKQKARPKINGRPVASGAIEIVSPEFDLLTGVRGIANLPKGFLKTNKLPQGENLYYRQLNKNSRGLERAKSVGVIDTKSSGGRDIVTQSGLKLRLGKTFDTPFFSKGELWYNKVDDMDVIIGKDNPLLDWKMITQHGRVTQNAAKAATRRTPFYNGEVNQAPTELFELYRRYPGLGYRNVTHGFPTVPITGLNTISENIDKKKCGGRRKAQLGLDIREGGIAIPIAPNMYYMNGRSHDEGGIGIGPNNKNGLEVEGGEVVKVDNDSIKVFSSVPLLRGVSPAQLVLGGANPNKVFRAQEDFKDRNRINDDGTTYKTGGLSRSSDYGSKKKPYPSVKSSDFAGGHRSYPIPTKADAIDALRLAGLHGRSDIKAKVYRRYPELRKKAEFGTYEPKRNEKGQIVLNPNNPNDVKWLREQQSTRGAKAVNKGKEAFIKGAVDRATPFLVTAALANPVTTALSLAGSYALGEVGEKTGEIFKDITGKDYTKEGKVIGQTIGGITGNPILRGFGRNVMQGWNAFKTNRLNSTQTLVEVPEISLTSYRPSRTKSNKQISQTNTQKYLLTEVEDLTWKEPKALLETEAQVTRRDLKNFNRWAKLFGYEPVPLRYAETKSIADRHVQDRIKQHNTFLRGVAKPNKLQRQSVEYELAKEGITNPTDYDVYTYMATHSAPTTGAGRADLRPIQVRKHKVGNFNLSKTSDSPIGALYTQGSGRGAAGYAGMGPESGGHRRTGVVVEVARPTHFRPGASYAEWVKENDFNFGDELSQSWHKNIANRIVETGKAPQTYNLSDEYKKNLSNTIKKVINEEEAPNYDIISNALQYIKNTHPKYLKKVTQLEESAFNMLSNAEKKAYNEYLGEVMISPDVHTSFKTHIDKMNNKFNKLFRENIIRSSKKHKRNWLIEHSNYNSEDYTQPDFSVLKSTTRNRGNAQQHYIFRAPIGEKILEGRGFYLPTEEEIINATTDHYPLWTPGYSRNTRKYGGIKKFKYGGSMIYEINGNVKNGLMSLRPKAEWGKGTSEEEYKNIKYLRTPNGFIFENGQSALRDGLISIFNHSPEFMDMAIKKQSNKRPQYYAEKMLPIAGSKSIAEKAGLARSGWSYADDSYTINGLNYNIPSITEPKSSTPRKGSNKVSGSTTKAAKTTTNNSRLYEDAPIGKATYNRPNLYIEGLKNNAIDVTPINAALVKGINTSNIDLSSTGGQPQSRLIGQYKPTNVEDWIGLGSNAIGILASYFINKDLINKLPMPQKPVMTPVVKLKTGYNIEPRLTESREAELSDIAAVERNVASSNVAAARRQRISNRARQERAGYYGQEENIKTQLINQDRLNRQNIISRNVAAHNDWLNRVANTKLTQSFMRSSNINNLISGLAGGVGDMLSRIESRGATNNSLRAIAAANPNVDARLIGGFDYYTDMYGRKYDKNGKLIKG